MAEYDAIMQTEITIDRAGRIVIPKSLRDGLRIAPGDTLEVEQVDDHLVLKPVRPDTPMVNKRGIWIYMPENTLPENAILEAIDEMREERIRELS